MLGMRVSQADIRKNLSPMAEHSESVVRVSHSNLNTVT